MESLIRKYRDKLDEIDSRILELLVERTNTAKDLVAKKIQAGLPVYSSERESEIFRLLLQENKDRISSDTVQFIFDKLLEESKRRAVIGTHDSCEIYREMTRMRPLFIMGPCSVESREQINNLARELSEAGVKFLRGGSYKPRTSPNSFQGLGAEGIKMLKEAAEKHGMYTVTEVLNIDQLLNLYRYIDVIQIGSRSMNSFSFLKAIGEITAKDNKPVILKRGFSATVNEFLQAAEYIKYEGNENIILCLRGIRTYEQMDSDFRYTPDLGAIIELNERSDYPIIFDPSHSTGDSVYVSKFAKAALSLGAAGVMAEVHDDPRHALSDGRQSIMPDEAAELIRYCRNLYPEERI